MAAFRAFGAIMMAATIAIALSQDFDSVVPEAEFDEAISMIQDEDDAAVMQHKKTMKSILSLRAYCELAYDKAVDFKETHSRSTDTSIVGFMTIFGEKKQDKNIVLAYAKAMGKAKALFPGGIGMYLLEHLDKTVRAGTDTTERFQMGNLWKQRVSSKLLGLVTPPQYINKLAVSSPSFTTLEASIHKKQSSADTEAATAWLLAGEKKEFKSFKEVEDKEDDDKKRQHIEVQEAKALKAIKANFAKNGGQLNGLYAPGLKAADNVIAPVVRTEQQKEDAAKKAADDWKKKQAGIDAANEQEKLIQQKALQTEAEKLFKAKQTKLCESVKCGPGGTCSMPAAGNVGDYRCTCAVGYEGGGLKNQCKDRNECDGVDCGIGGKCHQEVGQKTTDFMCKCDKNLVGGGVNKGCSSKQEAPCFGKEELASGVGLTCMAHIWKEAGCTTVTKYTTWQQKQTYKTLVSDSKIWATSKDATHVKGCYNK